MRKAKLRDQIEKLRALAASHANPHEADRAAEKLQQFEALLSAKSTRGIFEKVPGSGVWWIRYVDAQKRYRREVAGSWSQARDLLAKRRGQALAGAKLPEKLRKPVATFGEIAEDALAYSKAHKRSHRDDKCRMTKLVQWFGDLPADSIDGHQLEQKLLNAFAAETNGKNKKGGPPRKWAPSTFNHYKSLLQMTYREARRSGKVTTNPAKDIRHKREDNSRVRFLTRGKDGEYERLLAVVRRDYPEHLAELIFSVNTGLRLSSQYEATWDMIDFERKVIDIPRTKNDQPVHIPLNADALAALRSLPSWEEWKKGEKRIFRIFRSPRNPDRPLLSNDHWFKPALKDAGIRDYTWHCNRHTFASWLVQEGVPINRVSWLLGHKSIVMTMRYAHLAPSQLNEDVARLETNSTTVAPAVKPETAVPASYLN
jgi:integrase